MLSVGLVAEPVDLIYNRLGATIGMVIVVMEIMIWCYMLRSRESIAT